MGETTHPKDNVHPNLALRFGECAQMGFGEVSTLQEEEPEEAGWLLWVAHGQERADGGWDLPPHCPSCPTASLWGCSAPTLHHPELEGTRLIKSNTSKWPHLGVISNVLSTGTAKEDFGTFLLKQTGFWEMREQLCSGQVKSQYLCWLAWVIWRFWDTLCVPFLCLTREVCSLGMAQAETQDEDI